MKSAFALLRYVVPVWLYRIFSHYFINNTIFLKIVTLYKSVFLLPLGLSEMLLILRITEPVVAINVHTYVCRVGVIFFRF